MVDLSGWISTSRKGRNPSGEGCSMVKLRFITWHHPVSILKYMYMFNARSIVSHVHYLYGGADCQGDAVQILACNRDPCNGRVEINITHLSQRFGEEPGNKSFIVALTLNL